MFKNNKILIEKIKVDAYLLLLNYIFYQFILASYLYQDISHLYLLQKICFYDLLVKAS